MEQFNEVVMAAVQKMHDDGRFQQIIEDKVESTLTRVVDDALHPYGDFGKTLEKALKDGLQINVDDLGFAGYNQLVLGVIKRKMEGVLQTAGLERLEKDMEELLASPPAEITVQELVDAMMKQHSEDKEDECDASCTAILEVDNSYGSTYCHLYLDPNDDTRKYNCKYSLAWNGKGEVYSAQIEGKDPKKDLFMGRLHEFEKLVFSIYAAGSTIITPEDEYLETTYPGTDY